MSDPLSPNDLIYSAALGHQVGLGRYSAKVSEDLIAILDESEREIKDLLEKRLANLSAKTLAGRDFTTDRYQNLIGIIRELRAEAMASAYAQLGSDLRDLVGYEVGFTAAVIGAGVPVIVDFVTPTAAFLSSLVTERPFEGATLKAWAAAMTQQDLERITRAIQNGMVQGEGIEDIVRRVVGTNVFNGADGATQATRTQIASIVRTAVNAYSNSARQAMFDQNADIVDIEIFVATLDARTTILCASLDGKKFKRGEGPIPPLHFRCRSTRVAVMLDKLIGDRPFKAGYEKLYLRLFADEQGLSKVPRNRDALPRGMKGLYDDFARGKAREFTGTLPAHTDFESWIKRQSPDFVENYFGKARADLFLSGKLNLKQFIDDGGRKLTLKQLAAMDKAGLKQLELDLLDNASKP